MFNSECHTPHFLSTHYDVIQQVVELSAFTAFLAFAFIAFVHCFALLFQTEISPHRLNITSASASAVTDLSYF